MASREEYYTKFEQHLELAETDKKHATTRQMHATLASLYYQLFKDQPRTSFVNFV